MPEMQRPDALLLPDRLRRGRLILGRTDEDIRRSASPVESLPGDVGLLVRKMTPEVSSWILAIRNRRMTVSDAPWQPPVYTDRLT